MYTSVLVRYTTTVSAGLLKLRTVGYHHVSGITVS